MPPPSPAETLRKNRERATSLASRAGTERTQRLLQKAQRDLERRLREAEGLRGPGTESFSAVQMRVTLHQVKDVLRTLKGGMHGAITDAGKIAAEQSAHGTLKYLAEQEKRFRGIAEQPLALDQAAIVDRAVSGTESSMLRRLASDPNDPRGRGILDRYGDAVIGNFEEQLQLRFVARQPWELVKANLIAESPFLQGAPASWAERIVRTEAMFGSNAANLSTLKQADQELGDMVKILSATFDDRTGCLVGETLLTGAVIRTAFRRRYEGPVVKLVTKSGRDLTATPNHPVLTRRGWVRADDLRPGDDLVCDDGQEDMGSSSNQNADDRPATMREIFDALGAFSISDRRRCSKDDFHGDGGYGDVDVLRPHRELRHGRFAPLLKPTSNDVFTPTDALHFCQECGTLLGPDAGIESRGLGCGSDGLLRFLKATCDCALGSIQVFADLLYRFSVAVTLSYLFCRHLAMAGVGIADVLFPLPFAVLPRDATLSDQLCDVSSVVPKGCCHLGNGHPAAVKFDRLVSIEQFSFRGHVFNLSTRDGYFTANGIYTSNSDSIAVHGQIRRVNEPFDTWYGQFQHPPDRSNDREIVVPHRIAWPIPAYLEPRGAGEVSARWAKQGRKGGHPPIPRRSTIPIEQFGRG